MEEPNKIKSKIVKTYAQDMAEMLETDKTGLIKKIIHGEAEHEEERKNFSPESTKNKIFMLMSLLFVLVALSTFSLLFFNRKIPTVSVAEQFVPIIFLDQNVFFDVKDFDKDKVVQTILHEVSHTKVKEGGVEGIYLGYGKKPLGLRDFIALIKANFVPGEANSVSDNFLLGMVNGKTSPDSLLERNFFIILKVRTLPDVFSSLRAWEGKMFLDLHDFFGVSISSETEYLLTKDFEDGIIENKNARILYDKDKKIVMAVIFADDNSVIIANTTDVAEEIIMRLASSQIKK